MDDVYCFSGNPLDRASERRDDDDWIAKRLDDPQTRLLALAVLGTDNRRAVDLHLGQE
jgi:hypothetical protein